MGLQGDRPAKAMHTRPRSRKNQGLERRRCSPNALLGTRRRLAPPSVPAAAPPDSFRGFARGLSCCRNTPRPPPPGSVFVPPQGFVCISAAPPGALGGRSAGSLQAGSVRTPRELGTGRAAVGCGERHAIPACPNLLSSKPDRLSERPASPQREDGRSGNAAGHCLWSRFVG